MKYPFRRWEDLYPSKRAEAWFWFGVLVTPKCWPSLLEARRHRKAMEAIDD